MSSQAIIIDRSAAGEHGDYAVALTGTDASRTLSIGSNWTRIRIGVRQAVSSSSAQNTTIGQPRWCIGLCSSTSSTYSSTNAHYVGMDTNAGFLINHFGTSPGYYLTSLDGGNGGATRRWVTKVGTTTTQFGSSQTDDLGAYITSGSPTRTVHYLDISKQISGTSSVDPGLWTLQWYRPISPIATDWPASSFYAQLSNDTASTVVTAYIEQRVPVSESINGALTTVNIYWDKSDPALEVSDVAVWRFA